MRRINPTAKFIGIFLPAIFLALVYRPYLNLAAFGGCVILLLLSKAGAMPIIKSLAPATILSAGMFATGYYYGADSAYGIREGLITDAAVYNGLQLSSRVLVFAGLGMLFALTTDKIEFMRSLEQQAKLPPKFAYGILAAWGMLPNMKQEYNKTRAAFYARGMHPFFASPQLLAPLLVKSIRWSEALAAAMESKGFGDAQARTHYRRMTVNLRDALFAVAFTAAVGAGIAFWR